MIREDFLWIVPPILIAFIQLKFIWGKLPLVNHTETELAGHYSDLDRIKIDYLVTGLYLVFWLQIGFPLLTMTSDEFLILSLRSVGYVLVLIGFIVSLISLKRLGTNWTGMTDYRIKKNQQLIITGVYSKIRHPIFKIINDHITNEELLLEKKFGDEFKSYKHKTKKLIPFVY